MSYISVEICVKQYFWNKLCSKVSTQNLQVLWRFITHCLNSFRKSNHLTRSHIFKDHHGDSVWLGSDSLTHTRFHTRYKITFICRALSIKSIGMKSMWSGYDFVVSHGQACYQYLCVIIFILRICEWFPMLFHQSKCCIHPFKLIFLSSTVFATWIADEVCGPCCGFHIDIILDYWFDHSDLKTWQTGKLSQCILAIT